jgi:hypothetical protein
MADLQKPDAGSKNDDAPQEEPKAPKRKLGDADFWCEPVKPGAVTDPVKGKRIKEDGTEYYCTPYEDYLKAQGRRYDSGVAKTLPSPTDLRNLVVPCVFG